jgi:hypothetical protein
VSSKRKENKKRRGMDGRMDGGGVVVHAACVFFTHQTPHAAARGWEGAREASSLRPHPLPTHLSWGPGRATIKTSQHKTNNDTFCYSFLGGEGLREGMCLCHHGGGGVERESGVGARLASREGGREREDALSSRITKTKKRNEKEKTCLHETTNNLKVNEKGSLSEHSVHIK